MAVGVPAAGGSARQGVECGSWSKSLLSTEVRIHRQKLLLTFTNVHTHTKHVLILPRQAKDKTQILMKLNGDVGLESQRGWRYALGLGQQRAWYDSLPCFQTLDLLILLRHTLDNTTQCCCCSCLLSCRLAWVDCRAARAVGGRGRVVAAAASNPAQPG